jgi:HlyD family secretion protein
MRKKMIIGVIVVALIGGAVFFRAERNNKNKYIEIKTAAVTKGDIKSYLSTTAVIKSKNSKEYFGQQMKIAKVNVKVGDSVKNGQELLTYDVSDINNSIKQAQIQYNNAVLSKQILSNNNRDIKSNIADMNKKIADIDKQIKDIDKQISDIKNNDNPLDDAKLPELIKAREGLIQTKEGYKKSKDSLKTIPTEQFKQADNSITLAKITLDSAKDKIADGKDSISADFDGIVTAVNVTEGGFGNPAVAAIVVQDIEDLKAVLAVGKYDAPKIQLDQPAEIKSDSGIINGKVSFIDPVAKKTVGAAGTETTLSTEIDILDKPIGLKVDFDTDVNVLLGEKNNIIKVPAEVIKSDKNGRIFVYVVEGEQAVEKTVKLGLQSDMEVEVVEGLKIGDKVILNPVAAIKNGTLVKENTGGETK